MTHLDLFLGQSDFILKFDKTFQSSVRYKTNVWAYSKSKKQFFLSTKDKKSSQTDLEWVSMPFRKRKNSWFYP